MARRHMQGERRDNTLQTTALVHEVYMRLVDVKKVEWRHERAYPEAVYLPGLAYLRLRKGTEAAVEFGKIRKAFQDFFALWTEADADLPLLAAHEKSARSFSDQ